MTASGNMPPPDSNDGSDLLHLALPVSQKVVLVIDLVESVRLMAADEAGTVARWHDFAQTAQHHTIPAHQGRLVKSLGDGLMVEFENPRDAANAAHTLHAVIQKGNAGQTADRQMHLRAGINATHVYTDNNDIYGAGVNLAARIATLAGPGETVVTAQVRDGLTDGLDATIEDLGECYLKHIDEPVRVFRLEAQASLPRSSFDSGMPISLHPVIAIVPFDPRGGGQVHAAIGDLIADGIIGHLSKASEIKVISRLSSAALRGTTNPLEIAGNLLSANYLVTGSYSVSGFGDQAKILVTTELASVTTQQVVWSGRSLTDLQDLLAVQSEICEQISRETSKAILKFEIGQSSRYPLPNLNAYTLLLGAIGLTHRHVRGSFMQAQGILDHLVERYPKHPAPRAWYAKWHVMRVAQGWSSDHAKESNQARKHLATVLDRNPEDSLALTIDGLVHAYIDKDLSVARNRYETALQINPNESLAWLFRSGINSYEGQGLEATVDATRALELSPLDPLQYYYDNFALMAWLTAGDYTRAIQFGERSLRANRYHGSTLRLLTIAQAMGGEIEKARITGKALRQQEPEFSVGKYSDRFPGRDAPYFSSYLKALHLAGIPD